MTVTTKLTTVVLASLGLALLATTAMADRREGGDRQGGGGGFMQMDFAALDADGDGKVTPAEIAAAQAARLAAADTDGDGFLSADELTAMVAAQRQEREGQMATRMIERQDRDGDGKLSLAEMAPRSAPERMFDRMDTDNDGALSEAELEAARQMMAERQGGHGKRGEKRRGGNN